jgi:hypothetical protein
MEVTIIAAGAMAFKDDFARVAALLRVSRRTSLGRARDFGLELVQDQRWN